MFCFPISDHVMLLEGIVSLMSSYARANVRITNAENKRQIPMRASRGLKWENKTYKLKRSIEQGLYYLTPLGPISVHATSLRQAEQLTYVGRVTRMITHFDSRA